MESRKKILNALLYTFVIAIFVVLLIIAHHNFVLKEQNIINQDEVLKYNVLIDLNGADKVDKRVLSCTVSEEGCHIILPNAYRNEGNILGYNLNSDDKSARYKIGEEINVSGDMKLYVISSKENNLYIDDENIEYVFSNHLSCTMYNKDKNCTIEIPLFNKVGYETRGYSTSKSSLSGFIYPYEKYKISKDVTLYPIYGLTNHLHKIDVLKTIIVNKSIVEIEDGCPEDVYNEYLRYLNEINANASFLAIGSKITFLKDSTFNEIWGSNYVGMNYGPKNLKSLDIRCSNAVYNDYYGTIVHEMSHSWDFYYSTKMNGNITSQSDIINLFNKYSKLLSRPFRDYSYSSIYEFFADMVRYYYFKYIVPTNSYSIFDYPEDIKNVLEKYVCIAQNNYDDNMC